MKKLRRSTVVIPGNVPVFLEKCRRLECDVLLFDLQDAVARVDAAKQEARDLVVATLKGGGFRAREICVRVNSPGSPWVADDIKAVVNAGVDSIMVSHAYGTQDVLFVEGCLHSMAPGNTVEVVMEVDTPAVLVNLEEIGRTSSRITGISVGSYDFSLELGARLFGPHGNKAENWLNYCRGKVVAVARAFGWNAGDYVEADPTDEEALRAGMHASRGLGFDGVTLVFPRLIPIANEIYGVSAQELAWATKLVEGWKLSDNGPDWNKGARQVDGKMVFSPEYEYACRVIMHRLVIDGDSEAIARFQKFGLASTDYLIEQKVRMD